LESALEKKYITDDERLQMFGLADRAIGKSVRFVEYLDTAGPDWKKEFLMQRREAYGAERRSKQAGNLEAKNLYANANENENPEL
jgi:hypothetical protein